MKNQIESLGYIVVVRKDLDGVLATAYSRKRWSMDRKVKAPTEEQALHELLVVVKKDVETAGPSGNGDGGGGGMRR